MEMNYSRYRWEPSQLDLSPASAFLLQLEEQSHVHQHLIKTVCCENSFLKRRKYLPKVLGEIHQILLSD